MQSWVAEEAVQRRPESRARVPRRRDRRWRRHCHRPRGVHNHIHAVAGRSRGERPRGSRLTTINTLRDHFRVVVKQVVDVTYLDEENNPFIVRT